MDSLIVFAIFSALESVSTDKGKGGVCLMVSTGDALHLQLKVQLQRFSRCQVNQGQVFPKRSRQEVVGLRSFVCQQAV